MDVCHTSSATRLTYCWCSKVTSLILSSCYHVIMSSCIISSHHHMPHMLTHCLCSITLKGDSPYLYFVAILFLDISIQNSKNIRLTTISKKMIKLSRMQYEGDLSTFLKWSDQALEILLF